MESEDSPKPTAKVTKAAIGGKAKKKKGKRPSGYAQRRLKAIRDSSSGVLKVPKIANEQFEVEEEDPDASRRKLGFLKVMLAANDSIEAECLRDVATAITLNHVIGMDNRELIKLSTAWIETSVAPTYLDALKTQDENASTTFLEKLSPSDEILACTRVVDGNLLNVVDRKMLVDRFYVQVQLLDRADYRLVKVNQSTKLAVFMEEVVVKAYNDYAGKNYKLYAVLFKMGLSDLMQKRLNFLDRLEKPDWKGLRFFYYPSEIKPKENPFAWHVFFGFGQAFPQHQ